MSNVYTWSTTAASNNSAAPNGAPEGMAPSAVNNVIRENMKTIADWRDFLGGAKTTVGTDTITLTSGLSITAYAAGQMFVAKLGGTNTGAATINIDSVGAVAVEINGAAVAAGDFTSGKYVLFVYDGVAFQATKLSAAGVVAASETVSGIVELATIDETNTGTDATRAVTPDGLAGSIFGTAVVPLMPFDSGTACAVGNGAGSILFRVPSVLNGMNLVGVAAACATTGTTGTMDIQIANVTQAADMLTTKITIDSGETDSSTAATPAVIDTANDDVATGDQLRIDVDVIHTTPATGLMVELQFRLP